MSNFNMIENAVNIFRKNDCPSELMYYISTYPFEDTKVNLNMIKILKEKLKAHIKLK